MRHIIFFACLLSLFGCIKNNQNENTVAEEEGLDWTPDQFKKEHYDEWFVVKHCIDIQQQSKEIDYSKIDVYVKDYIRQKGIVLPQDDYHRILSIDSLCRSRFDIRDYDTSNIGMHIADGTFRLFQGYVNWLFTNAASKWEETGIDLKEEEKQIKEILEVFSDCCDSIGGAFGGSGSWCGWAEIHWEELLFMQSMYKAIMNPQTPEKQPFLLTPRHFQKESEERSKHYVQDCESTTTQENAAALYDRYVKALTQWLEFRGKVEKGISDAARRAHYSHVTRTIAKKQYVHLKNSFYDVGICSASMYENVYLHTDCTDREMLEYNYEKAYERYISK